MQTQHACTLHRRGGGGTELGLSVCFGFLVLTNCSVYTGCFPCAMKEYLRGTLGREPALVWLSVSESAVYQGGRGELCSIRRGDQETTKKGGRGQRHRERGRQRQKVGDKASAPTQPGVCSQLLLPPARPQLPKFPKIARQPRTKPFIEQPFRRRFTYKHHLA